MPYDDEPTPFAEASEPSAELDALARCVIGVLIEVHRVIGPGFLEQIYEQAVAVELGLQQIGFERQVPVPVHYKGVPIGAGRMDFLIEGKLVLRSRHARRYLPSTRRRSCRTYARPDIN